MCDDKNQNYVYKIVLCMCVEVVRSVLCCTGVLFSVAPVLFCSVYSVFCIDIYVCKCIIVHLCILYLCMCVSCICSVCVHVCVLCVCACACACVCIVCVREVPVEVSTQSDTPHSGCLCGYMVRIIKYKKTQPLIKLKSI